MAMSNVFPATYSYQQVVPQTPQRGVNYAPYQPSQTMPQYSNQYYTPQGSTVLPSPTYTADYSGLVWVQGQAGANAFPVAPGQTVALMDSQAPVLYIKSADQTGKPLPLEIYDLVKREDTEKEAETSSATQQADYITRSEFEELKQLLRQQQHPTIEQPIVSQNKEVSQIAEPVV